LSTQKLPLSEVQLKLKQIREDHLSAFQSKALHSVLRSYIRVSKSPFSHRPVFGFMMSKPLLLCPVAQYFQ
jgi:hypothetical protein